MCDERDAVGSITFERYCRVDGVRTWWQYSTFSLQTYLNHENCPCLGNGSFSPPQRSFSTLQFLSARFPRLQIIHTDTDSAALGQLWKDRRSEGQRCRVVIIKNVSEIGPFSAEEEFEGFGLGFLITELSNKGVVMPKFPEADSLAGFVVKQV